MKVRSDKVFVIGASAGGIETVRELLRELPRDFPAPILLVIHTPTDSPGLLARVLQRESKLPVVNAMDGALIERSHVYVAPPNFHLLAEGNRMRLINGPEENRHRPAIDPLFRSAARSLVPAVVGVVLSGYLDDVGAGLFRIKTAGGITIVQDPGDALVADMPRNAAERVDPDYIVQIRELGGVMLRLASVKVVVDVIKKYQEKTAELSEEKAGTPSAQSCPECHGVLWESEEGGTLKFRCRVGHSVTADSMLEDQGVDVERALWAALRVQATREAHSEGTRRETTKAA